MVFSTWPNRTAKARQRGWTLIELMVVMAIIAIMVGAAVPLTRMFSRNDMRDAARTVYTMLRAARMYAMAYNVETAVVYSLDFPFAASGDGGQTFEPMLDTILVDPEMPPALAGPLTVRTIRAAAVMYRLPDALNARRDNLPTGVSTGDPEIMRSSFDNNQGIPWLGVGTFVPTPASGEFVPLSQGYSLLLVEPRHSYDTSAGTPEDALGQRLPNNHIALYSTDFELGFYDEETRYYLLDYNRQMESWAIRDDDYNGYRPSLERLGMRPVHVYPFTMETVRTPDGSYGIHYDESLIRPMIAHVFRPDGSLKTRVHMKEQYRLLVGPDPETFPEDRVVEVAPGQFQAIGIPVEIQRTTGSVRLDR